MQNAGANADDRRFRVLLWVFCLSFAFDYRGEAGGPPVQAVFLGTAILSGSWAVLTNLRCLRVRPGIYMLLLWWGFLVTTVIVALMNGTELGRYARVVIPYGLCGLGLAVAQVASVRGVRVQEIVTAVLMAAVVNVAWRGIYGAAFNDISVETVRVEILSPGINWLMAYIGVGLLLRNRFSPWLLIPMSLCGTLIFFSVTRGTLLPPIAATIATLFCLMLSILWGIIPASWAAGKLLRISFIVIFGVMIIAMAALVQPKVLERWEDRLFHHAGEVTSKDVSWLTREAEAVGIWTSLMDDAPAIVYGKGMGSSYFWDASYFPELYLVYPEDMDFNKETWFAGHSSWTFALFSGGVIGVLCTIGFVLSVMGLSLRCVYRNRNLPGFRIDLAFLPFVATFCLLSESITSNPFDERFAGLVFGIMAGLPQFFCNRACLRERAEAQAGIDAMEAAVRLGETTGVEPLMGHGSFRPVINQGTP